VAKKLFDMANPLMVIKKRLDRRSERINRQKNAMNLQAQLAELYKQPISNTQRRMINELRVEYQQKARESGELYMQKEIDILKDEKLRF